MPLYEYRCTACGYSFEKIQNFSAKPETECPKCQGELIRPVTAPALRFEGAGWYVNDYAGKGAAQKAAAAGESGAKTGGEAAASTDAKTGSKPETKSDSGATSTETKATPAPAATASAPAASTSSST